MNKKMWLPLVIIGSLGVLATSFGFIKFSGSSSDVKPYDAQLARKQMYRTMEHNGGSRKNKGQLGNKKTKRR